MPDLRRYRTRCASLWARERGATDQLCAGREQLSPHRHLQDMFMAAMREALCRRILRDDELAQACFVSDLNPNQLRNYEDLEQIPDHQPLAGEKRQQRRLDKIVKNTLCDLGWSEPRRRSVRPSMEQLACRAGNWHLPRVLRWQGDRFFSPCFQKLAWPAKTLLNQGICPCGRAGQWSPQQGVLPL